MIKRILGVGLGAFLLYSCSNAAPDDEGAAGAAASGGAQSGASSSAGTTSGGGGATGGSTGGTSGGAPASGTGGGGVTGTGGTPNAAGASVAGSSTGGTAGGSGAMAGGSAGGAPAGGSGAVAGSVGGAAGQSGGSGAGGTSEAGTSGSGGTVSGASGSGGTAGKAPAMSLSEAYAGLFPMGAAVDAQSYMTHGSVLTKHFDSITPENEMKFVSLQNTEGRFTYDAADRMVAFAQQNDMKIRGHALVWHTQNPSWLFQNASRDTLLARMRSHISNVVRHFQGKVYCWDVVNEAFMDDGSYRDGNEEEGKQSQWYAILGESYIAEAFRAAHEADPDAKLFYNDFYNYIPAKQQAIYEMLRGLLDDGVPVHGVGLQAHLNIEPSTNPSNQAYHQHVEKMEDAIELYASLGLEVQVTEMDVSLYIPGITYTSDQFYTEATFTDELETKQAERYRAFFDMFRRHADVVTGVTFWGIADDNTWLSEFSSGRKDFPLLFDTRHDPKKAYDAVIDF
ncbi:MAG TPA: endo-1,4-beta-xylanase [Polyangiaceae bacterium]